MLEYQQKLHDHTQSVDETKIRNVTLKRNTYTGKNLLDEEYICQDDDVGDYGTHEKGTARGGLAKN